VEAPCARRDQTERHLFLRVQCREIAGIDGEREQLESVGSGLFEKHPIQNVRVDVGVELVHGREVGHGVRIAGRRRTVRLTAARGKKRSSDQEQGRPTQRSSEHADPPRTQSNRILPRPPVFLPDARAVLSAKRFPTPHGHM